MQFEDLSWSAYFVETLETQFVMPAQPDAVLICALNHFHCTYWFCFLFLIVSFGEPVAGLGHITDLQSLTSSQIIAYIITNLNLYLNRSETHNNL